MPPFLCCHFPYRRREQAPGHVHLATGLTTAYPQRSPEIANDGARSPLDLDLLGDRIQPHSAAERILSPRSASMIVESTPFMDGPAQPSQSISHLRLSGTSDRSQGNGSTTVIDDHYFLAREIWSSAYASIKKDPALQTYVEKYESFFNNVLWPQGLARTDSGLGCPTLTVNKDWDKMSGEARFRKVAAGYVEASKKYAAAAGIASAAVQFVQKTKDIVSSVLSVSPPASIAWAGICLVLLPVIINHSEQIAAKQTGFSYVMSRFAWYSEALDLLNRDYWKSPHSFSALHQSIRDELVVLYKLLIEYQLRTYYTYCRRLKTFSRDLVRLDDWSGMIAAIKEAESRLQEYMDLNFDQHLLDKLHTIAEEAVRKQRNDLLNKFKFPEELPYAVYQAYLDSIDTPQDGTGLGVLQHPRFLEWAQHSSGILILSGIPGSGKSVLAKSMLKALPKLRATTVCSFFFKDNNGRGQNMATTALCRVLDELFNTEPTLVDRSSSVLQNLLPAEVRCNLDLLWDVLIESTKHMDPGSITVVLDALDECTPESAAKLFKKLESYLGTWMAATNGNSGGPPMKFMITTRPFASSQQPFDWEAATVIRIHEDPYCLKYLSEDIEHVVATRFENFAKRCIRDDVLKGQLLELVRPKRDRTYLYVKLLFDCLDLRVRDGLPRVPRDWITSFKTLPETVKDAYSKFLGRVHEGHRNDVKLMLQLVVAAARPLTVRELNIALNIRDCRNGSPDGLGLQPPELFRDWILDACKFFLDVYNDHVYFIHQTAKDYLLSDASAGDDDNPSSAKPAWLGNFSVVDCHSAMAESCAAYLALPFRSRAKFGRQARSAETMPEAKKFGSHHHLWDFDELDFSNYASQHWRGHVQQGQVLVHPLLKRGCLATSSDACISNIRTLQSWDSRLMTFLRCNIAPDHINIADLASRLVKQEAQPVHGVHLDIGSSGGGGTRKMMDGTGAGAGALSIGIDAQSRVFISDERGMPISRLPRVPLAAPDCLERVTAALHALGLIRTLRALGSYHFYSPLEAPDRDWFSIRLFNETGSVALEDASFRRVEARHGDSLSYVISARVPDDRIPVHVHMLSLNASWTISTLLWNARVVGERSGEITVTIPRKVCEETDGDDIEDTIIVVFCVGEQAVDRFRTAADWLRRVYLPPVLLLEGTHQSVPTWLPFVPPPSWQVRYFEIHTVPVHGVDLEEEEEG
ncbi:hypothetical protein QBC47DRAFT_460409 [Echria macrotheca]|uniref:NACHT domain-containing protein n=1 Tax=Echria macrotheca TaxID=438768 RepID=A0AAJ0BGE1_9PEZI|nr:hypothetical protein QBC47DRAFT_460409 [Echria macrotheca]